MTPTTVLVRAVCGACGLELAARSVPALSDAIDAHRRYVEQLEAVQRPMYDAVHEGLEAGRTVVAMPHAQM